MLCLSVFVDRILYTYIKYVFTPHTKYVCITYNVYISFYFRSRLSRSINHQSYVSLSPPVLVTFCLSLPVFVPLSASLCLSPPLSVSLGVSLSPLALFIYFSLYLSTRINLLSRLSFYVIKFFEVVVE